MHTRTRSYWVKDHHQECSNRNPFNAMIPWQSFEYHEVTPAARRELYVARDSTFAALEAPMVLSMWKPLEHSYYWPEALYGTEEDKEITRFIGLSEDVVGSLEAFVDTCQHGCVFSRIDEFRS